MGCQQTGYRQVHHTSKLTPPYHQTLQTLTGAPNDQFVVKCIIIPQLMKINVIKAFSVFFTVAGKTLSVPFSQQDTQEISQPAIFSKGKIPKRHACKSKALKRSKPENTVQKSQPLRSCVGLSILATSYGAYSDPFPTGLLKCPHSYLPGQGNGLKCTTVNSF